MDLPGSLTGNFRVRAIRSAFHDARHWLPRRKHQAELRRQALKLRFMSMVDDELAQLEILRAAKLIGAYLECSDAVRAGIRDMIAILNDPATDKDDREMALATLADAIFPDRRKGQLGVDLEQSERDEAAEDAQWRQTVQRMDAEEAVFAERLRALMAERHVTQEQLAARIGVGQPAISNMLSRQCRPQRRTVLRLAEALEVEAAELWPESADARETS